MKREETLMIERFLQEETHKKVLYGCEEVTIGFHNNGHGNEIVDFMSMDSKGIIKCYEIKISLQDLKSDAKKSWYGNYNYLVVTEKLYQEVTDWSVFLPAGTGLVLASEKTKGFSLRSVIKARKQNISAETSMMLKESLVRSIYYKMEKYKSYGDEQEFKMLKKKLRIKQKEYDYLKERYITMRNLEHKLSQCIGKYFGLYDIRKMDEMISLFEEKNNCSSFSE